MDRSRKTIKMFTENDKKTSKTVKHYSIEAKPKDRVEIVRHLISKYSKGGRVLIFTKTKMDANFLSEDLNMRNHPLHSDFDQKVRERRLQNFKSGKVKVLIATDVAARGLDVPSVELVIQISPPNNVESYIHRSGRTGRAGKEGVSCIIVNKSDHSESDIFRRIKTTSNTNF